MTSMRILQLCPFLHAGVVSGVANHVLNLSKQLQELGHDVTVFSAKLGARMAYREEIEGITVRHLRVMKVAPVKAGYLPHLEWLRAIRLGHFDLIHAHSYAYFPSYTAAIAARRTTPVVLTTHQPPTSAAFENKRLADLYNRTVGHFALQRCDRVIALTKLEAMYLETSLLLDRQKVAIIPNGVDLETFNPGAMRRAARRTVLFVGRLSEEKGVFDLLRAVPLVLKKVPDAVFMLVGDDGETQACLSRLARNLKIDSKVSICGPLFGSELVEAYRSAQLLVAPSIYETFGLSILEGMAVGLPIVASCVGGIPELVQDMVNGILVQPSDPEKLAEAVIRLLSNQELATKISQNNIAKAQSYSWERIAMSVLQVYVEAMEANPRKTTQQARCAR